MKHITELEHVDIAGKTVLVRVDYNVPVVDGMVVDDLRIRASFDTVNFLKNKGAHIILISHIENKEQPSLLAISNHINQKFINGEYPFAVFFCNDLPKALYAQDTYLTGDELSAQYNLISADSERHQILLFENLRSVPGEKENNVDFSRVLAGLADYYVNEAFSVSHREHASVVGVPQLIDAHYAGFSIIEEIKYLQQGIHPTHPFIFILGGAKFETKLPLIEKFLSRADKVIIGGALFNDILKAKGYEVGTSLVSETTVDLSAVISNEKLIIPQTVIVLREDGQVVTVSIDEIGPTDNIVDIGPDLISELKHYVEEAQQTHTQKPFVLWNGPMGLYESGYTEQTIAIAKVITDADLPTLIGGGDTAAAVSAVDTISSNIYISTGGGAMIEFLLKETLPGIDALK